MNAVPIVELPEDRQKAVHLAVDVADLMALESLDFAKNAIGYSVQRDVLTLAMAHLRVSAMVYATHELNAVIREVVPEVAGAISEAGTDVGAGIAEGLSVALRSAIPKKARCRDSQQTDDEPNNAMPGVPVAVGAIHPALQKIIDDDKLAVPMPPDVRERLKTLRADVASSGAIAQQSKT